MSTYQIKEGDSLELISRKVYGTENESNILRTANPDLTGELPAGATIFIPDSPYMSDVVIGSESNSQDEVALSIENRRFRFWESVTITKTIDLTSTIEFTAPFEPDVQFFRDTFKPMTYKSIGVTVGGSPLFNGTMLLPQPAETPESTRVTVTGYSKAGVLNDCSLPATLFPLEYNKQTLQQIASSVCQPFGINVSSISTGASFERVAAKPQEKVLQFLVTLAGQRNKIISDTPLGELLIQESVQAGSPVARLETGLSPLVSVTPQLNPQQYYSHITGIQPTLAGRNGTKFTVKNALAQGFLRPATFTSNDAQDGDLKTTVEAKTGRMFANTIAYTIRLNTWRDSSGNLWEPNTTITLTAPGAMIYSEYEFLIKQVVLTATAETRNAELTLVLPGSYSGDLPTRLPWD